VRRPDDDVLAGADFFTVEVLTWRGLNGTRNLLILRCSESHERHLCRCVIFWQLSGDQRRSATLLIWFDEHRRYAAGTTHLRFTSLSVIGSLLLTR
jgi:hypothetical protein